MKVGRQLLWIILILALCSAIALQGNENRPRHRTLDAWPDTAGTRALTSAESLVVLQAITNIATPPPDSISYYDTNGTVTKVSCLNIANDLLRQLDSGRIRVDTTSTEGEDGESGYTDADGDPKIGNDFVALLKHYLDNLMGDPRKRAHLEEFFVHERQHKLQTSAELKSDWWEMIPLAAESAYKAATELPPTDPEFANVIIALHNNRSIYDDEHPRPPKRWYFQWHDGVLFFDPDPTGVDTLSLFELGDSSRIDYAVTALRASDMMVYDDHFLLPPGHTLSVIFGGVPTFGMARIHALGVFDGAVVGPTLTLDFGPPLYPPMFFYSVTHSHHNGLYYVLDTLNQQILTMEDTNRDSIPDEIIGQFASAAWPGFSQLEGMRGIDATFHRTMGFGLLVNHRDTHVPRHRYPGAEYWFLPDIDGLPGADLCMSAPLYQFITLFPSISVPVPWAGETSVLLYGSWNHDLAVYTTDSTGQILLQPLGFVQMQEGFEDVCYLSRPLLPLEYILPVDLNTGERPTRPKQVAYNAPRELTLYLKQDGLLHMTWQGVAGANHYRLYQSNDGAEYIDTGLITPETEIAFPPDAGNARRCYMVTAVR